MSDKQTLYTPDRQWKAELWAFKNNYGFYKSIGSEVRTYHWEKKKQLWWETWDWVERPVSYISIVNRYTGSLINNAPGAARRSVEKLNESYAEEKLWAVGINIKINNDLGEVSGGGGPATLDVRSVESMVRITINDHKLQGSVSAR